MWQFQTRFCSLLMCTSFRIKNLAVCFESLCQHIPDKFPECHFVCGGWLFLIRFIWKSLFHRRYQNTFRSDCNDEIDRVILNVSCWMDLWRKQHWLCRFSQCKQQAYCSKLGCILEGTQASLTGWWSHTFLNASRRILSRTPRSMWPLSQEKGFLQQNTASLCVAKAGR